MDGQSGKQMERWGKRQTDRRMDIEMECGTNRWTNGRMYGWTDKQTDSDLTVGHTERLTDYRVGKHSGIQTV